MNKNTINTMYWVLILFVLIVLIGLLVAYRGQLIGVFTPQSLFDNARVDELDMMYTVRDPNYIGKGERGGKLRIKNLDKYPRSKSEAEVIRYLEEITGDKFPTAYPKWLIWKGKHLELDGFNGKIALEFSGPLHTKWSPKFEPYINYFERVVRDVVKRRLCKKNGIKLIIVDATLPSKHWRNYVLSRLFDINAVENRPTVYIDEQTAVPYRNEQIEAELNISNEYDVANHL